MKKAPLHLALLAGAGLLLSVAATAQPIGVIDEPALIEALVNGQIAGVGLDVTATEPDVPQALREHPRALILPHIASATSGTAERSPCARGVLLTPRGLTGPTVLAV